MTTFGRPENKEPKVGEPDWSKPSLGVICFNGVDGCVLFHAGPHLDLEIREAGLHSLEDLGLDNAPVGISVWEGKIVDTSHQTQEGYEYDHELQGTFRAPTELEWQEIRDGVCPWDSEDWLIKETK